MNNRGFTFLEMLLVMALFAIVGLSSVAVLSTVTQSDAASKLSIARLQQLQRAMLLLERDIMQISPRYVRIEGDAPQQERLWGEQYLLESEDHGVSFTQQGWRNPGMLLPRSEVQAVAYRLQDGQLQRLFNVYVDAVNNTEPQQQNLLAEVEQFQLTYYSAGEWEERWQHQYLPEAIKVRIKQRDLGELERIFVLPNALWRKGGL
ncbi:type II secretion system minor pseudopilin GspJ [Alishewanella sp. 16-MA]|uniref:Type II secretion system protein J n=1 Tax=Alishewanella maricola TaxID=2795740 RepID=A0ABS8C537_9ALTE|nr:MULTISPECIES: type II secretion system minor pseudopilin GspJ [Alishewanella]MDP4945598.1 type II secretion system minor pseudopilin GspJ [Alishewanella sp.]MDP5208048.1 type II secretion system minor pseudopilin GspJ [Alishewanella sp. SMS9]MCB5227248.1 type II secretion system minor pseudopilin GspJ [Alishewanella maricola]MDP5035828.1 type II secretion system minor pseudopilin GspJ [Alishewanella sp.]MDP5186940.1 type II secretion system minor pseudopilin GspJ [Alishewanella sp.]